MSKQSAYNRRKENGLCCYCGAAKEPGNETTACFPCAKKKKAQYKSKSKIIATSVVEERLDADLCYDEDVALLALLKLLSCPRLLRRHAKPREQDMRSGHVKKHEG